MTKKEVYTWFAKTNMKIARLLSAYLENAGEEEHIKCRLHCETCMTYSAAYDIPEQKSTLLELLYDHRNHELVIEFGEYW